MGDTVYEVRCEWDDESGVWVASSDGVPGLVAEAGTVDDLVGEIKILVPELLDLNRGIKGPAEVSLVITSHREERVRFPAA
jgi:predicted RNase H-like HicB family nuclease